MTGQVGAEVRGLHRPGAAAGRHDEPGLGQGPSQQRGVPVVVGAALRRVPAHHADQPAAAARAPRARRRRPGRAGTGRAARRGRRRCGSPRRTRGRRGWTRRSRPRARRTARPGCRGGRGRRSPARRGPPGRPARPGRAAGPRPSGSRRQPRNSAPRASSRSRTSPRLRRSTSWSCQPVIDVAPRATRRSKSSSVSISTWRRAELFMPTSCPSARQGTQRASASTSAKSACSSTSRPRATNQEADVVAVAHQEVQAGRVGHQVHRLRQVDHDQPLTRRQHVVRRQVAVGHALAVRTRSSRRGAGRTR